MAKPILYYTEMSPPSRAVLLTANAIELDLETNNINMLKGEHLKESYLKINPQHTIPTLDDDGFILWDSHAIMRYLVDKFAKDDALYPKDLQMRAMIDQRLHFEAEMIFVRFRNVFIPPLFMGKPLSEEAVAALEESCANLNQMLEGKKWLVGDSYTIADISCVSSASGLSTIFTMDKYPNVQTWLQTCEEELPGYAEINVPGLKQITSMMKPLFEK